MIRRVNNGWILVLLSPLITVLVIFISVDKLLQHAVHKH